VNFIVKLLLALLLVGSVATTATAQCSVVRVGVDLDWKPYFAQSEEGYSGLAVDFLNKVFADLNLTVQYYPLQRKNDMLNSLLVGDIDLMLSYPNQELYPIATVLEPSFVQDNLQIITRAKKRIPFSDFTDLRGLQGVVRQGLVLDKRLQPKDNFLFLQYKNNLAAALTSMQNREVDFLIATENQVKSLKRNMQDPTIIAAQDLLQSAVNFVFSNKSECIIYAPFISKLITDGNYISDLLPVYFN